MLTLFTPSCRASGKILTSQMQNSFSPRSPSRARPRRKRARLLLIALLQLQQTIIRPSSTRDLELQIRLTEAQNQKLALELKVLRLRRADGSADANTPNSCTQPTAAKTRKKRRVDWPHEFAPGNFSSGDYDTLDLPDFVGGFLSMIKSYDAPLESAMLELLELLMACLLYTSPSPRDA